MRHVHRVLALNSTLCNASLTSATAVEGAETLEPEFGAAPLILTHLQISCFVIIVPIPIDHFDLYTL
jgi:hypothetical protein